MSSRATKETVRSLDKAQYLINATVTHQPIVSARLKESFGSLLPQGEGQGPIPIDWDATQQSNVGLLELASGKLREEAQSYRALKAKSSALRGERQKLAADGRESFRGMRQLFEGTYLDRAMAIVGLNVPPVVPVQAFHEQCLDVITRLENPQTAEDIGPPKPGRPPLDLPALAGSLSSEAETLDRVTRALNATEKLRDEALSTRDGAQRNFNRVYANVARIQEAYCRLAGFDDLADRIRLTIPQRSTAPTSGDEQDADAGPSATDHLGATDDPKADDDPDDQDDDDSDSAG